MAAPSPPWSYPVMKAIADVLADTSDGLTGREIGDLLLRLHMDDPVPTATKRDRLAEAFVSRQNKDQSSRRIITFIVMATPLGGQPPPTPLPGSLTRPGGRMPRGTLDRQ